MQEYELGANEAGLGRAELLSRQRANLKKRLGLEGPMAGLLATEDMFNDDDLLAQQQQPGAARRKGGGSDGVAAAGLTTG